MDTAEKVAADILKPRPVSQKDQLHYNVVLLDLIRSCLLYKDSEIGARYIENLAASLMWEVPGLPFRSRIEEFRKELDKARAEAYHRTLHPERDEDRPTMFALGVVPKKKLNIHYNYYNQLLAFLLQLFAEHQATMKAKEYVEEGDF